MTQDYRNLAVWERAMELSVGIYQLTRSLPKEELYGLTLADAEGQRFDCEQHRRGTRPIDAG